MGDRSELDFVVFLVLDGFGFDKDLAIEVASVFGVVVHVLKESFLDYREFVFEGLLVVLIFVETLT